MDRLPHDQFEPVNPARDTESQRNAARDSMLLSATLRLAGGEGRVVRVRNLSDGGLMAEYADFVAEGTAAEIDLRGLGKVPGTVAWVADGRIGISFDRPVDPRRARKPVGLKAERRSRDW